MNYRSLFLATLALPVMIACSSSDGTPEESQPTAELQLVSTLTGAQTRGALDSDGSITRLQGTQIAASETVYAWVEDNDGTASKSYVDAWTLTAVGDGTFTGAKQYYPATGDNVDVYCLHGNFGAALTGAFPTAALTHTVMADQSTAASYTKSDLLYGSVQNQGRKAEQPIVFKHKLSKIEVKLQAGAGLTAAQLADATTTVTLLGLKNVATYTPAKAPALASGGDIAAYGGTVSATGTATDIKMYLQKDNSTGATVVVFGEAVVVPQSVSATADFLKIRIPDGGDLLARLGGTGDKTFEAGKKYLYTVTVNLSGISLTSTITDWSDGTGDNLNADIE